MGFSVGDRIEVRRVLVLEKGAQEAWRPALILGMEAATLAIAYDDGTTDRRHWHVSNVRLADQADQTASPPN